MTDPLSEARVLRLLLASLDDNDVQAVDAITGIIADWEFCRDCSLAVILAMLSMLTDNIRCDHHRDAWETYIKARLSALLDGLAADR